ncbi:hypothetical protein [Brevibacillus sp. HD1.4A]|uniref:hypothetical protein n=1 Tax=Brevibacillus sp. HD1.4A TaxID=2738978 RepID=UPI00156B4166|nr:hypothetical protein [Brevibacillus sp. HD1.4A]NRQ54495.1 hypothetical protein [Brevibacillus sp. HD1.4A]
MIFVKLDSNNNIVEIHHMPFDPVYGLNKTEAELLEEGALVDAIPEPVYIEGKAAVLKYNPTEKVLYYNYEDVPLPPEALVIKQLEQQVVLLQQETKVDITQAKKEQDIRDKIAAGQITPDNFSTLTIEEQELVKLVLFKDFAPTNEDVPKALSAVEFGLVALFKLLGKAIDRTKLTQEEQAFLDGLVGIIGLNDMPINDTTDWRYQYFHQQFEQTQQNRQEYFNKKMSVTGTI